MNKHTSVSTIGARALSAWATYWFEPLPQRAMAICRIVFGTVVFLAYAELIPVFGMLYGASGIGGALFRAHVARPHVVARSAYADLDWLGGLGEAPLRILFVLLLASALAFAAGCFTRVSGVVMIVLHVLFMARLQYAFWGWAVMLSPLAAYVVASPASRACSVDAKWRGVEVPAKASAVPLRLLQIHCVCIYLTVVSARLGTPYWLDGSALYRILSDRTFSRFPEAWHGSKGPLAALGSAALLLEWSAILLLWRGWISRCVALVLILMHLTLEVLTMVGWWNALQIAMLSTFVEAGWRSRDGTAAQPRETSLSLPATALAVTCSVYAALLALSSLSWAPWPRPLAAIGRISRTAESALKRATVLPGVALFVQSADTPVVRRGNCVTIEATSANGTTAREQHPVEHCERRATPRELPKAANALIMLLHDAAEQRYPYDGGRMPTRGPARLAAVGEYYCHGRGRPSALAPAQVRVQWDEDLRHIDTGREWRKRTLDAAWDCTQHQFVALDWDLSVDLDVDESVTGSAEPPGSAMAGGGLLEVERGAPGGPVEAEHVEQ